MAKAPHEVVAEGYESKPRTEAERMAYVTGYASAIIDIDGEGMGFARKWLSQMAESEERMAEAKERRGETG